MLALAAYDVPAQKKASGERRDAASEIDAGVDKQARQMLETGRRVLRFDTFGSEAFWRVVLVEAGAGSLSCPECASAGPPYGG
jgi:hypothetical protein